jgi:hypothetical protein
LHPQEVAFDTQKSCLPEGLAKRIGIALALPNAAMAQSKCPARSSVSANIAVK